LKERLEGPILDSIIDPKDYSVDDIMKSYFKEILFLARRYTRPTVDYEDLVGEGIIGLLDAIERFDIDKAKGNPRAFHNLAVVRIKSYMFNFFLANNNQYTIPNYMSRAMNLVEQIRNIISAQSNVSDPQEALLNLECPNFDETVSQEVAHKLAKVKDKLKRLASNSEKTYEHMVMSVLKVERDIENYESESDMEGSTPEDITGDREFMNKFLNNLQPTARGVMSKILEGKTLEEVGKEMDFTRERARQVRDATIKYFRQTPMYQEALEED
jgi:RNA polymerase sigma factor for flagellar operon FliA